MPRTWLRVVRALGQCCWKARAIQGYSKEYQSRKHGIKISSSRNLQKLFELLQIDPADKSRPGDMTRARTLLRTRPQLPGLLASAALSAGSFFHKGKEWITSFLDTIPTLAVRTSLVMQTNKNGTRAWTTNDIYDIEALEAAVPYCDVVVTEKYACHIINQSGLAERFATKMIRSLDDLTPILRSLT